MEKEGKVGGEGVEGRVGEGVEGRVGGDGVGGRRVEKGWMGGGWRRGGWVGEEGQMGCKECKVNQNWGGGSIYCIAYLMSFGRSRS